MMQTMEIGWPEERTEPGHARARSEQDVGVLPWLDMIYEHKVLMGHCRAGRGLSVDEIDSLSVIEAAFAPNQRLANERRAHKRVAVAFDGSLRLTGRRSQVRVLVHITDVSLDGVACHAAGLAEGQQGDLVIHDASCGASYVFKTRVAWCLDVGGEAVAGLEFVGTPVRLRNVAHE